jgi:hypothetical protein
MPKKDVVDVGSGKRKRRHVARVEVCGKVTVVDEPTSPR